MEQLRVLGQSTRKDYPVQASTRDEMLVWVSAIDDARVERNKRPADSTAASSVNPASVSKGSEHASPSKSASANGATRNSDSEDSSDDD